MFSIIYRGYIIPEHEVEYVQLWQTIAEHFIETQGALGSRLHKTDDGMYLAYSCWPNRATWENSWQGGTQLPAPIKEAIFKMKSFAKTPFEEIPLDIISDKLIPICAS